MNWLKSKFEKKVDTPTVVTPPAAPKYGVMDLHESIVTEFYDNSIDNENGESQVVLDLESDSEKCEKYKSVLNDPANRKSYAVTENPLIFDSYNWTDKKYFYAFEYNNKLNFFKNENDVKMKGRDIKIVGEDGKYIDKRIEGFVDGVFFARIKGIKDDPPVKLKCWQIKVNLQGGGRRSRNQRKSRRSRKQRNQRKSRRSRR